MESSLLRWSEEVESLLLRVFTSDYGSQHIKKVITTSPLLEKLVARAKRTEAGPGASEDTGPAVNETNLVVSMALLEQVVFEVKSSFVKYHIKESAQGGTRDGNRSPLRSSMSLIKPVNPDLGLNVPPFGRNQKTVATSINPPQIEADDDDGLFRSDSSIPKSSSQLRQGFEAQRHLHRPVSRNDQKHGAIRFNKSR